MSHSGSVTVSRSSTTFTDGPKPLGLHHPAASFALPRGCGPQYVRGQSRDDTKCLVTTAIHTGEVIAGQSRQSSAERIHPA